MKLQSNYRISIGMPVYNDAKYVEEAIQSALAQTYNNFILHISDNASTDDSGEICKRLAAQDERIKYHRQEENIGPVKNFNFLKHNANSEYFIWLACDDRWDPKFLEMAISVMDKDKKCSIVFSNYILRNLETKEEEFVVVKTSLALSTFRRCAIRLKNMQPSMVYGLQRFQMVKNIDLGFFDFSDVFYLFEVSIQGKIRIINQVCYYAGIKGERVPYSLTGDRICRTMFLKQSIALFYNNLHFVKATILSIMVLYTMFIQKFGPIIHSIISIFRRK